MEMLGITVSETVAARMHHMRHRKPRTPAPAGWGSRDVTGVRALACTGCGLITLQRDLAILQAEVAKNPELFTWND
ncbi:hypothetical protein GCM10010435_82000 [Winogradskya consettensis]|uniref:Uncharacterized protein n=1 Tax=Winogradskya consettensis TaxID=113560 RepID=A0A919SX50_9ACTN|nr:hypothetical protein [Actinoplanes consettensis]GIM79056.1 hypothetical protein Aco04nite_63580 [Actinoplanes consettensis]